MQEGWRSATSFDTLGDKLNEFEQELAESTL